MPFGIPTNSLVNVFVVLVCILCALPVTTILFNILNSRAEYVRKGKDGSTTISLGGAAAGFFLAFLLAYQAIQQSYHPEPEFAPAWYEGQWEVLNSDEPDLYAIWTFEHHEGDLSVSGIVWKDGWNEDETAQEREFVMKFGPFPVNVDSRGRLEFDYTSDLGSGRASFDLALAMTGTYLDNPTATSIPETDQGRILVHRDVFDWQAFSLQALIWSAIVVSGYAWIVAAVSYALFRHMKSKGMVNRGPWVLGGPIAFFYVFFPLVSHLGAMKPLEPNLSPTGMSGTWKLEYFDQRDRFGELHVERNGEELKVTPTLFRRESVSSLKTIPRSKSGTSGVGRYDGHSETFEFDYQSTVGTGRAKLRATPALRGHFFDDSGSDEATINAGELIAVKR